MSSAIINSPAKKLPFGDISNRQSPSKKLCIEKVNKQTNNEEILNIHQYNIQKLADELKRKIDNPQTTVIEFCDNLRDEVFISLQSAIEHLNKESEKLMNQINTYQNKLIENIEKETNEFKEATEKELNEAIITAKICDEDDYDEQKLNKLSKEFNRFVKETRDKLKVVVFKDNFFKLDQNDEFLTSKYPLGTLRAYDLVGYNLNYVEEIELIRTIECNVSVDFLIASPTTSDLFIIGDGSKLIKIWNWQTGVLKKSLSGHSEAVNDLVFMSNGDLISCSSDKTVKVWDMGKAVVKRTLRGHKDSVNKVATLKCNDNVASASSDRTVKIWHVESGNLLKTLKLKSEDGAYSMISLPNDHLACSTDDDIIQIWDVESGLLVKKIKDSASPFKLAISPDQQHLVSSANSINFYNLNTWEFEYKIENSNNMHFMSEFTYLPTRHILWCNASDGVLCLVDPKTMANSKFRVFNTNCDAANALIVLPNNYIATASNEECQIKIWKIFQ